MTIDDAARLVGHAVWLERRGFEILGAWVRDPDDTVARLVFAVQSRHHGWRAEQLAGVLPSTRDHDPEAFVAPTDADAAARVDAWAAAVGHARLAAARGLLDESLAHAERARAELHPVADGPARRLLDVAAHDARADRAALDAAGRGAGATGGGGPASGGKDVQGPR